MKGTSTPAPAATIATTYRDPHRLKQLQAEFKRGLGFVRLPSFLSPPTLDRVRADVEMLHRIRKRRDFRMPGFDTERKMSVVGGDIIGRVCSSLLTLYGDALLHAAIATIVGRPVRQVSHKDEFMVANFLDRRSDTHGWHTDDPKYALVVICDAPEPGAGGALEFIADWAEFCAQCGSQTGIEERVARARAQGRVHQERFDAGDAYLLDAGANLHRVTPLLGSGRRQALNMAFDDRAFRRYGQTAQLLYGIAGA